MNLVHYKPSLSHLAIMMTAHS